MCDQNPSVFDRVRRRNFDPVFIKSKCFRGFEVDSVLASGRSLMRGAKSKALP
jgi:hypothetical protein